MQKLFIITMAILFSAMGAFADSKAQNRIDYLKQRIKFAEDDIKEWRKELKKLQSEGGVFAELNSPEPFSDSNDDDVTPLNLSAILMVNNASGAATAFVGKIDGKIYLISNLHVLGEMKNAKITTFDGKTVRLPRNCYLQKGFDVFLAELDSVPDGVIPLEVSSNVTSDTKLRDKLVVCGNSQGGNVIRNIEGNLLAVGPKLIESDCNFYQGNSGSPVIHKDSGKVIGVVSYIMIINDNISSKITKNSKADNFKIRFFAYRLDTMDKQQQIPYETVVDAMEILNTAEKKLKYIITFIVEMKYPMGGEYPELAKIASNYQSAIDDASGLSNSKNAINRVTYAKRTMLSKLELLAAAESMKIKSLSANDIFSEKCDNILKGYQNVKNFCNKRAKDYL